MLWSCLFVPETADWFFTGGVRGEVGSMKINKVLRSLLKNLSPIGLYLKDLAFDFPH